MTNPTSNKPSKTPKVKCPKCGSHAVTTKYMSYTNVCNVCMICGCLHQIGASRESLDRQVKGDAWKNPREEAPIRVVPDYKHKPSKLSSLPAMSAPPRIEEVSDFRGLV